MGLTISLLGPPSVERDGQRRPNPRGAKPWALLALLLLSGGPLSRQRLAGLLFGGADDPLGSLRWNLAELRRLLGTEVAVVGDPVELRLPADAIVDVHTLATGTWLEALRLPGLGRELLEGVQPATDAAFEAWLLAERRRFAGMTAGVLREAAVTRLAAGEPRHAVDLAVRLVALDEYDEEAQSLLVRAYAATGDAATARSHLERVAQRFRDDLGVEPSASLIGAADLVTGATSSRPGPGKRATAESLITAGEAAIGAGATEAGLETLRRSVADAEDFGDRSVTARALVALGEALIHGIRGRDGEGATTLHAALTLGEELGDPAITSQAAREMGYVEMLRGRYGRADAWLRRALEDAPDDGLRAAALGVSGAVATDRGRTAEAIDLVTRSAEMATALDRRRLVAWALAFRGRAHVLRGELPQARDALERAIAAARSSGWLAYVPFPQALLGEVALLEGRLTEARSELEAAFALGCQIGDPCWEGMGARGIGLVLIAEGDVDDGIRWLDDARTRCVRLPDTYLWIQAYCLDALVEQAASLGLAGTERWLADLEAVAARTGMTELLVRALLHRDALGVRGARDSAAVFAADIDNPVVLRQLVLH